MQATTVYKVALILRRSYYADIRIARIIIASAITIGTLQHSYYNNIGTLTTTGAYYGALAYYGTRHYYDVGTGPFSKRTYINAVVVASPIAL